MTHRNRKPSNSTEIVGTKTHAELEADWLKDFQRNVIPDRPTPDHRSISEMAAIAKCHPEVMRRYVMSNLSKYESVVAIIESPAGSRIKATLFRFKQ